MTLHMLHLPIRSLNLMAAGREHHLVRDSWTVDTGYLVHALFARLLGERAPKPFDLQTDAQTGGHRVRVLAYADDDHTTLARVAKKTADTSALDAIAWEEASSKPMPVFAEGHWLGFHLRVCPVVRVGKHHPRFAPGSEVDPYLAVIERELAQREQTQPGTDATLRKAAVVAQSPSREIVYQDWLAGRLKDAAALHSISLASMRDAHLWRRGRPGDGPASRMYGQPRRREGGRAVLGRREAVFEGVLQVRDPSAFRALLGRGVGRHRAFGFGMLLLKPATIG